MHDQATHLLRLMRAGEDDGGGIAVLAPSVPTGVVSFRPPPAHGAAPPPSARPLRLARAIAVTSGKGGVGKSNVAVNLSVALAHLGLRVCLLDADLGMANADLLCGVSPAITLEHVVSGQYALTEAALLAPGGFRLFPGASGVTRLADLAPDDRDALLRQLAHLERSSDVIVIDTGAGISGNVLAFACAAHRVLVVTTPEPTAMTDGYGIIKAITVRSPGASIDLVVNMAEDAEEATEVHRRVDLVARRFLRRGIAFSAAIPADPRVREAVQSRVPYLLYAPDAHGAHEIGGLARRLAGREEEAEVAPGGFFARLSRLLRRRGPSP